MIRGVKRKVALAFVAAVLATTGGGILALRTSWAGERLCALAEARVRQATGLRLELAQCRVEPFRLEVSARAVRLGPEGAPLFEADAVRARLAPVQALGKRLELAELTLSRPRVKATIPPLRPGAAPAPCPPPLLEKFEIHELRVDGGAVDVTLPGGERVRVSRVDVRSTPVASRRGIAALAPAGARRAGLEVAVAGARLDAGGRVVAVDEALVAADLSLDFSRLDIHLATADLPGASLAATGTVEQLCRPRIDLAASVRGDIPALLALAGRNGTSSAGTVVADLTATGPVTRPEVRGEVRLAGVVLDGWNPGDAKAQFRLAGSELQVDRLELPTLGGRIAAHARLGLGREVKLDAEAALDSVELGEILARLKLPGAWVMARVTGKVRASGTAWPLRLTGEAGLDLAEFRVLDHGWERYRPGEQAFLELGRSRVDAGVRVDRAGVHIEEGHVRAGAGALAVRGTLHFDGDRGFEFACDGGADLSSLRHLGPVPVRGLAQLDGAIVRAAPYGNPHAEAHVRVRGFEFLDLDLGEVTGAALSYDEFILRARGVQGRRGATRYDVDTAVDFSKDAEVVEARFSAQGRLRDVFEAAMRWQPSAVHARDALDADVLVQGTAHGPPSALEVAFQGELGRGELAGRPFDGGGFAGRVEKGQQVVFETAELRRGPGRARASGRIGFGRPFPWELEASFSDVRLADLALPGAAWSGTVSGAASLGGSYEEPRLQASAEGDGVRVGDVPLGSVKLGARLAGVALSITGAVEGARVAVAASTTGDMPFEARGDLELEDALRYVPGGPPAGLHAYARGSGTASGVLKDLGAARAELTLHEVRGGYGDFKVESAAPIVLTVEGRRVALRPFSFRGQNTHFSLSGAREPSGELALDARGTLDLRLLGGLLPGVTDPRGRLLVEAHVSGTLSDPLLVGAGQLREAGFQIRELPVVFTGVTGALVFSQNRMLFDRLDAAVNGGRAELAGEVELVRFFPAKVRVGATFDEVPMHIPEWLHPVVSGRLQAAGTWDAMLLSGKLHVVSARYTDAVDLERRVVEGRKKAIEKPFDRAGEWLSFDVALAVDGDARIENDLVRGALKGDLTLTGTLASVGLIGTLTLAEGSRGTFRGNEFVLTHAVVDFTERRRIRMSLDVHGEADVRDYQIFMHLFGSYEDPTLQLTSQPALTQQDIVTLLSLGYTARDTASGGVAGLAAAAAAQALLSASGLDDQVKRFVPRSKLLRDFSMRFTSAYSELAGQVEPRAEFESKVLDDRFRLRYQAPLAAARGQRAQAEMRLSSHTSIQYQWDNENPDVASGGDHGVDLKLRWEWAD